MSSKKPKLELTWIGKEHRPRLEPRILLEVPEHSHHAAHRVPEQDILDKQREEVIALMKSKLRQESALTPLFAVRWSLS